MIKMGNRHTCKNTDTMLPIDQPYLRTGIGFWLRHVVDKPSLVSRVRAVDRYCIIQSEYIISISMFHDIPVGEMNLGPVIYK